MHPILRPAAVPIARLLGSRTFAGAADVISGLRALHEERLLDAAAWTPHQHHDALIEIGAIDLSLARLAEGHTDAQMIARELGHTLRSSIYGVWAAEPPGATLEVASSRETTLSGTKRYASGAGAIDRALVTAGDRLFDVDVRAPQVRAVAGTWEAVGMADSGSFDVVFDRAPAIEVGPPRGYVERPGFAHGGIRVAAVWLGGAIGTARALEKRLRTKLAASPLSTVDPHEAASFGRIVSTCAAMRETIAASVGVDSPEISALHVRRAVEHGCDEVLREAGRAGGSSLMVFDHAHARRVADLTVYLRQHHGSRDDERLGRMLLEASCSS